MTTGDLLLDVDDLVVHHHSAQGIVKAVDGVSLTVRRGETVAVIGESGCGKSTLARAIMGLYKPVSGQIRFEDEDITSRAHAVFSDRRHPVRRRLQMVFQDPLTSLNPRTTVGKIVEEPLSVHRIGTRAERHSRARELLAKVGLSAEAADRLPHEFSGGQRQRIGIARALALSPDLIVCDEPVSALDLSVQAQVLNLLTDLQAEFGLSYLFISHDLSVVRHVADRVLVMYLGRVVEEGSVDILQGDARHPYTRALVATAPGERQDRNQRLRLAAGEVPSPIDRPSGCFFHTRCPEKRQQCVESSPPLRLREPGHAVACHFA